MVGPVANSHMHAVVMAAAWYLIPGRHWCHDINDSNQRSHCQAHSKAAREANEAERQQDQGNQRGCLVESIVLCLTSILW